MDKAKEIFFTVEGNENLERQEMPADCCVKDLVDEVTKQHKLKNGGDFKVHLVDKDDAFDDQTPVIDVPDDKPVHIGRCTRISVQIHYGGGTQKLTVSPGITIARLHDSAIKHFKPDDFRNKDYELEMASTEKQPDKSLPIGALVADGTCSVELNLVPAEKWQG